MRGYTDIYKDYLDWVYQRTKNENYKYEKFMADRDPIEAKAFLYKQILDLCYDKKDGLYYSVNLL